MMPMSASCDLYTMPWTLTATRYALIPAMASSLYTAAAAACRCLLLPACRRTDHPPCPHSPCCNPWQQAVKLADALLLKKYKGDQLLRALKAYALQRSGKQGEALQVGWAVWSGA